MSEATSLAALQDVDVQLLRHASALASMPQQKRLKTIELAKKKVASELSKLVGQRKDAELEIGDLEAALEHYQEKSLEVQAEAQERAHTHRELRDLEAQLTSLAKHEEKASYDLGPARENLEKLQLAEKNARLTAERLVREEAAERASLEEDSADLKAKIVELSHERDRLKAEISPEVLETYEAARKRFKGLAVETLHGNVPSICRVKLQPSLFHDLSHGPTITECPYCHRILITEDWEGDEGSES